MKEKKKEAERVARAERQAKLQEERKKKQEEEQKIVKEQARLKKLNPYFDEIATCDGLIAFLTSDLKPEKPKTFTTKFNTTTTTTNFDPNAFAKQGMKALKKTEEENDAWLYGEKKKKPKPKRTAPPLDLIPPPPPSGSSSLPKALPKQKPERKAPTLSATRWHAFDKIGVNPPLKGKEITKCIEELKKKKVYFESFKRTMEQLEAEEEAEAQRAEENRNVDKNIPAQETYIKETNKEEKEGLEFAEDNNTLNNEPNSEKDIQVADIECDVNSEIPNCDSSQSPKHGVDTDNIEE